MTAAILSERDIQFMLYELFDAESLIERSRYEDHSKETFNAAINTAQQIAAKYFVPIRKKVDEQQPTFDGKKVTMIPEIKVAVDAAIEAGFVSSTADYDYGGMQLPLMISTAANAYLSAAGSTTMGYIALTSANASLIENHGSPEQIEKWVKPMRSGRFAGTMAMTEPSAGSGLADLLTTAVPAEDGTYRISGSKIFISGGDHDLNDNIVHLVLARIKGAPAGVKGISLFIVPKVLVNDDGSLGERNDVALAGLFHKMGGRGHTSTALSFGEKDGAVGYLLGEANRGLSYMFHMMNEARIMVGTNAACTALVGYQYSLDYARERFQGRLPSCKDPLSPPVSIIEHADVRRMLLTQKAYSEGAFALCLFGAKLADDRHTANSDEERQKANTLLDFLTPIIKSWPSEYGPKSNDLAIQILGGHGYINEHPVEMFYRDNRLNPIHEGTTGIQSMDLLARKLPMNQMAGYRACLAEIQHDIEAAKLAGLSKAAEQLSVAVAILTKTTDHLLGSMMEKPIDLVLANSVKYLDMFGHVVIAWLWLRQGVVAQAALNAEPHQTEQDFYRGKLQAMTYFLNFELPLLEAWSTNLINLDATFYDMENSWF
ncbi:3-methylmercaptopropionyl-CoA dehydrogenase [Zhongshania aliphaticivorans]|uniref:3-methylmercaptopropionyl-CoA dehydrogenase n=1 Tax=Zhongshania aliphaticivorans TaxID=1470434 RepID=A0A5S9QKR1_9GAMM|nr:acyl-CoA dehydrogenase [Zhongshania aliphaticivorans]CAA0111530.1 3-methylmercaptopropionyl-CoA dehydrogenase [Zhongshania aliphaticivorans]CAA0118677.1 3-methylmercaptopropionyl-CoA dehydrogenase [Zhongshania aliphaticivorans]